MSDENRSSTITASGLFLLGFGLFMFTRRSELIPTLPVMIVIAPIFVLRFSRILSPLRGILLTLLGFVLAMNIALWGLFDVEASPVMIGANIARSSLIALLYFLPYLADRLLYPRFRRFGVIASLVFPIAAAAVFFLASLEGPIDGTTAKAIYGYGPTIIQQVSSLTGLWGFVFLYSWLAALVNHAWEQGFARRATLTAAALYGVLLAAIAVYGTIWMSVGAQNSGDTVKVAAIVLVPEDGETASMLDMLENHHLSDVDLTLARIGNLTATAAGNGAKIVSFQEFAMIIEATQEKALHAALRRIATENGIYLSVTYGMFGDKEKGANQQVLIDPQGEIVADYTKRYLLGIGDIGETVYFRKGAEVIRTVDTPYGRIAISICRDMDFPAYIRQAGRQGADIMLAPSYDFPKSHGPSYYQRAVENGFSFLRPTNNGVSYAEDYNGRILAQMDSEETDDGIMYADLPKKGVRTVYAVVGDLFGWICVSLLAAMIVVAPLLRKQV